MLISYMTRSTANEWNPPRRRFTSAHRERHLARLLMCVCFDCTHRQEWNSLGRRRPRERQRRRRRRGRRFRRRCGEVFIRRRRRCYGSAADLSWAAVLGQIRRRCGEAFIRRERRCYGSAAGFPWAEMGGSESRSHFYFDQNLHSGVLWRRRHSDIV